MVFNREYLFINRIEGSSQSSDRHRSCSQGYESEHHYTNIFGIDQNVCRNGLSLSVSSH